MPFDPCNYRVGYAAGNITGATIKDDAAFSSSRGEHDHAFTPVFKFTTNLFFFSTLKRNASVSGGLVPLSHAAINSN